MKNNIYTPERKNFNVTNRQVFVIIPFKQMLTFEKIIKPIGEGLNLNCILGGSIFEEGVLLDDIIKGIAESEFVIADLTDKNPNVFYELGIAHQLRKQVIIITQKEDDVPSDLKGHKWNLYNISSKEGIDNLEEKIKKSFNKLYIPSIISQDKKIIPISHKKGNETYLNSDFIENDDGTFMIWGHLSSPQDSNIDYNKFGRAWKYLFAHSGNSGELLEIKGQNEDGKEVPLQIYQNMLSVVKRYSKSSDGKTHSTWWRMAFNNSQSTNQIIECGNDDTTAPGWHLITFTWSRANNYVKFYVDAKLIGTKDMTFWPTKSETKGIVGTWTNRDKSHYFDNKVGPWKVWNKSLLFEDIDKEFRSKPKL